MLAFGAINGLQLVIAPTHFMSTWFGTPKEDLPADYTPKKFMGFDVMAENGCMTFMARNMGIYFRALSLVFAVHPIDGVSSMFYHPLWTLGAFLFFCAITMHNIHSIQLQDSDGPTPAHYKKTWIPQIIVGIGLCVIMLLTFVRLAPVAPTRRRWRDHPRRPPRHLRRGCDDPGRRRPEPQRPLDARQEHLPPETHQDRLANHASCMGIVPSATENKNP